MGCSIDGALSWTIPWKKLKKKVEIQGLFWSYGRKSEGKHDINFNFFHSFHLLQASW